MLHFTHEEHQLLFTDLLCCHAGHVVQSISGRSTEIILIPNFPTHLLTQIRLIGDVIRHQRANQATPAISTALATRTTLHRVETPLPSGRSQIAFRRALMAAATTEFAGGCVSTEAARDRGGTGRADGRRLRSTVSCIVGSIAGQSSETCHKTNARSDGPSADRGCWSRLSLNEFHRR